MINLTEEQLQSLHKAEVDPLRLVNPHTHETFVLLPLEEYQRLMQEEDCDASPWTEQEMDLLAIEAGEMLDSFGKEP